ncbi:autotransporter-associated beta strand repeat-containing protein, partial [Yersinia frederiksenii]|uniref:autotransporter-associated beta strand repeat-containing protein n=1 Tax=Yersinia frederiksenii TaxID=29484 RepID=UPI000A5966C7
MNKTPNPIHRSVAVGCGATLIRQYPRGNLSVLALLIFGILGSPSASAAFTPEVIGEEVTGESLEVFDTQNIRTGGIASDTTINSGGRQYIFDGGIANKTTINFEGGQYIDGGIANNTTINSSGGVQYISSGGVANDTTINAGMQSISSGGIANNTTINDGGNQDIYSGGIANNTTLDIYAKQYIFEGGIANDTTINGHGWQHVLNGGIANNTTINSGAQNVNDGGIANNTTIHGGVQHVINGSIANNTTINIGAQNVFDGGIANGTTINGDGYQWVGDSSIANDTTIYNNGGVIVYAEGRLTGQTIVNDRGTMRAYEGVIHNEGEVIFQRSDDYILDFDLTSTGGLTQNGPHTLTLSTASSYSGTTTVNGGIIKAGADNVFSASSDYITQAGGSLDLDGYHQTLQSLNHGGTVNFGGLGGNTLTITGDYSGNNGLLNMNSVLEDDGSVTDKLIIAGNTAGNT